ASAPATSAAPAPSAPAGMSPYSPARIPRPAWMTAAQIPLSREEGFGSLGGSARRNSPVTFSLATFCGVPLSATAQAAVDTWPAAAAHDNATIQGPAAGSDGHGDWQAAE